MNTKILIIIRGAPASGKSTLGRNLAQIFKKKSKTSLLIPDESKWVMTAHDKRSQEDFKLSFTNFKFTLKNYLKNNYTVITEDTWDNPPFENTSITKIGKKFGYTVYQFLLIGSPKTIQKHNKQRPMVIAEKQLAKQYKEIYSKQIKDEAKIVIDQKTPEQITKEVLRLIK